MALRRSSGLTLSILLGGCEGVQGQEVLARRTLDSALLST
jgi:hypothetical protein